MLEAKRSNLNSLYPWLVSLTASLLFFYEFIQTNIFSSLNVPIMREFGLNSLDLGFLASIYFYSSAMFILFAGNLLDRFSPRFFILLAMIFCTLGTLGIAVSPNVQWITVGRFVSGLGNSFSLIACVRIASYWLPANRMALMTGLSVAAAMLGGIVAQAPATLLIDQYGWRTAMWVDGILGVVIIALMWFIIKDRPNTLEAQVKQDKDIFHSLSLAKSLVIVLKNLQNWFAGLYVCLLNLPIFVLGALWGSLYLQQIHQCSREESSLIISLIYVGTAIGSPINGYLSDKIAKRRPMLILGALLSMLMILILMSNALELNKISLAAVFFCLGFFSSSQIISYPLVSESNPKILIATAVSTTSLSALLGGILGQPIFGWLINISSEAQNQYENGILFIFLASFIALLCAFMVYETRCREQVRITNTGQLQRIRYDTSYEI